MTISVDQITNSSGTGILDLLLDTVTKNLDASYQNKRITGKEYAEIYLGALPTMISQSIGYVTTVEQTNAQVALLQGQLAQVQAQTQLVNVQKDQALVEVQKANIEKDLLSKQLLKADKDLLIADKQIDVLTDQLAKSLVERALLQARVDTEKAQILDVVNGQPVAGIVGKQKELYGTQINGFKRDAEQKVLKALSDVWAIQKSTDPDQVSVIGTGMHNANINAVMNKVLSGIDVVPVAPPSVP